MAEPSDAPPPEHAAPTASTNGALAPESVAPAAVDGEARAEGDAEPAGAEKRKFPRTPLSLLVQFRFNTFEDFLAEYSIDISVGGMFIRTDSPRPEGSMIYLQFALRDGHKLIEGLGKVVRVNPPGGSTIPGMGVEFVNMDEESEGLIAEIVDTKVQRARPAP